MKNIFLIYFLLLITLIKSEKCELKISKSSSDLFKNTFIYNSGIVNQFWTEGNHNFISEYFNSIEYFYIMDTRVANHENTLVGYFLFLDF